MSSWFKFAAGWVIAALVATGLAWGAVAQVRSRVIRPSVDFTTVASFAAEEAPPDQSSTTTIQTIRIDAQAADNSIPATTQPDDQGPASVAPSQSATSTDPSGLSPDTTSTTQPAGSSSTTQPSSSTTIPTSSTTTTTVAAPVTQTSSYQLTGGTVTISYSPGVVNFVSAIPQPGFSTDIDKTGPDTVKVKFESGNHKSEFEAKWSSGQLDVSESEEGSSDD